MSAPEYSPRRKLAILFACIALSWFTVIGAVVSVAALWEMVK